MDPLAFRQALGQFAAGVAVITANADTQAIGMTVSSFNSVSLEPPLILFSIDRKARSLNGLLSARGFAVNILSRAQESLSTRFAQSRTDKWNAVRYTLGHSETPLLCGALAHFECTPYANYDGGDHVIVVGRVIRFALNAAGEPLVFFRSRYHSLAAAGAQPVWPLPMHY
ncbi:MAG: flavin reductase [Rhizobiales bacterium]|nr:flavin reductase [Hyphomicrobiales bacterium]